MRIIIGNDLIFVFLFILKVNLNRKIYDDNFEEVVWLNRECVGFFSWRFWICEM